MLESLPLMLLIPVFIGAAAVVWWAGIRLTDSTDALDRRMGLSDAVGGMLLLTIAAALPEIAITASAVAQGHIGLAAGNLLGGVAIHAVVLVVLDVAGSRRHPPLSCRTRTLMPVLEGLLVIATLSIVLMGSQLTPTTIARIEPSALLVVVVWAAGLITIQRANRKTLWSPDDDEQGESEDVGDKTADMSMGRVSGLFGMAAVLTLIAGVVLERSGSAIASHLGMEGVIFGATILAAAAAMPEISTGMEAVRRGDHQLAISDIFGANAFFLTLFLLAGVISGQAVISGIGHISLYLTAFAALLTVIYLMGLLMRSTRMLFRMGIDSLLVLILYALGVAALFLVG